ncbi:MAG TPA: alpha/beta fold hydrolase [Gaiellaceae bacterium]|nr:alpha/beta fold hydrolase [Gaiellaceae bacterium]
MARFVLVHGAWHGGWCWERLARELRQRGHDVSTPDLPCDALGLTVYDYADATGSDDEAVVVGHSMAGLVIPFVPARLTVFLGALVPAEDGYRGLVPGFPATELDELGRSYWATADTAATILYPDLTPAESAWAFGRLRSQAPIEAVFELPTGRRASIVTLRDRAIRPDWQAEQARSVLGVEPLELDAGHSPFITHPLELADLLESLA